MEKVLRPKILACKKKVPYGNFFLHAKIFGLNTFCIALHAINMDNFNYCYSKITKKNNKFNILEKQYRQLPWKQGRVGMDMKKLKVFFRKFRKYLILGKISLFLPIPKSNIRELSLS